MLDFEDFNFSGAVTPLYKDLPSQDRAGATFWNEGIVIFQSLIPAEKAQALAHFLFVQNQGQVSRRDLLMPTSNNTPRNMSVINGHFLDSVDPIRSLYEDPRLIAAIEVPAKASVEDLGMWNGEPYEWDGVTCFEDILEKMVATRLEKPGDTHGLHLDVPALSLIICLESPPEGTGGDVECYAQGPRGYPYLKRFRLEPGDGYLMRTDCIEHRVVPIAANHPRSILNLTYDFKGRKIEPNNSAELLFA